MPPGTRDAGFTLLELVAVLAIYSLIAVISTQVLSSALRNQGRAQSAMHDVTESVAILSVLRRDLETMTPTGSLPDRSDAFASDANGRITLMREPVRGGSGAGLERIEWGVDRETGTLWRRSSLPESVETRVPVAMLRGLEAWDVRALTGEGEWIPAESWSATDIAELPRAVEVRLHTAALGDLRMVAAR
jgi:general secretion pathway protein J